LVSMWPWQPAQSVPCLWPSDSWERLQSPRDPTVGISEYRKWMDGGFNVE